MAIPIALEDLVRIVAALEAQELGHLRVALFDLLAARPSVVGEVIAAAELDGAVNKTAEVVGRLAQAALIMIHMQVHNDTDPRFSRPGEHAFIIFLNETDRPVNELRTARCAAHRVR
jgi:hypothetical protein